MQEQPQEELQPERARVVRQEALVAKGLEDKLQNMLLAEPDVQNVMEGSAQLARAAERGEEPDFSWVPDRLRVQVMSEWNEARHRIALFKEAQQEAATARAMQVESLSAEDETEREIKTKALERQLEEASQEVAERAERRAIAAEPTLIGARPKKQTFFQRMLSRRKKSE